MLQDGVGLQQNLIVPEPQDGESLLAQPFGSASVGGRLDEMLAAVDFHDQPSLQAGEIDNVGAERLLAAEPATAKLSVAESAPQPPLGVGHVGPQSAGVGDNPVSHCSSLMI